MVVLLKPNAAAIEQCVIALSEGKIIAYPTETVYGLGTDAKNKETIKRLFQIKKRDIDKPLSVAVATLEKAKEIAVFNRTAEALAERFLPGPLTLIVRAVAPMPFISLNGKIGIRIPNNSFSQKLLKRFPNPVTATSANISGFGGVTRAADLDKRLVDSVDIVVDSIESEYKQESTVVEVLDSGCKILREGAIKAAEIENILNVRTEL